MSVSQVKKRFGEMESFLRGDKESLRRLKLLKDDVNVLRTSLAAAEEAKELAEVVKEAARERADKAEMALAELQKETHGLRQKVSGFEHAIRESDSQSRDSAERNNSDDRDADLGTESELKAVIKQVRKEIRELPQAEKRIMIDGEYQSVFERDQLVSGWSHKALWTLGATVALWSFTWGGIVIKSKERSSHLKVADPDKSGFSRHMVQWMSRNIDSTPTPETLLYELTTLV